MRVLITGASGYIGLGVAKAFRRAGHEVFGLVRSETNFDLLLQNEIFPIKGDLSNPSTFHSLVQTVQIVVHCAAENSPSKPALDLLAIDYFLEALSSPLPRTLIYTSGCWIYGNREGEQVDESSDVTPLNLVTWRPSHEQKVLACPHKNLRTVVIRPGFVYGESGSITGNLFEQAIKGEICVINEGLSFWPMIHLQDLARLYVLAAEKEATKTIFNATNMHENTSKQIAEALSKLTSASIRSISYETALQKWGPLAEGLSTSLKVSSERATHLLNWTACMPNFVDGIKQYFMAWQSFSKKK